MIVVTGTPRSGTSMIMQTLKLLGVPIVGEAFSFYNLEHHNPKGFWELDYKETFAGIKDDRYRGKGIKILGEGLLRTNPEMISKMIICQRWENFSIKSFVKCLADNKLYNLPPTRHNAEYLVKMCQKAVEIYLREFPKIQHIYVEYKNWIEDPEGQIKKLIDFLELKPGNIDDAIKNIAR